MNMRLESQRKEVIEAVENQCRGSAESVLPALFFADDLNPLQIVRLQAYIDMFNIGRGV